MSYPSVLEPYIGLVEYLGAVLGPQYEILLQDMENHVLMAVANGYISVRIKGGTITPLAAQIEQEGTWKQVDYLTNVRCENSLGHNVLASFFFIKSSERLSGVLCINFDATRFSESNSPNLDFIQGIVTHQPSAEPSPLSPDTDSLSSNMEHIVDETLSEYLAQNSTTVGKLSYKERRQVVAALKKRDVFRVRGSVGYVSKKLQCSSATLYRYLQQP